ncbi:MAG: transposase [Dehalococcoidia bacterium]|nr:transposase [Dehalococcoidia bacterium]
MRKQSTTEGQTSRVVWESLEEWARKKVQLKAKRQLPSIVYSESEQEAEEKRDLFVLWCKREGYDRASETLLSDWERMITFYRFPKEHWRHLRTTNVVDRPLQRSG